MLTICQSCHDSSFSSSHLNSFISISSMISPILLDAFCSSSYGRVPLLILLSSSAFSADSFSRSISICSSSRFSLNDSFLCFFLGSCLRTLLGFVFLDEFAIFAVAAHEILHQTVSAEYEQMIYELVEEMTVV